ncbi:transketolase [Agaricicola taiwanensis]|uniref:Transketolase n=1 Tax=Agaricicola taiwanensis TaxID=591372 RepID=A0A8J2VMQ6_9RHOB|nr:transketolase [Agaricicola taiwanensis]GGE39002.1 transketolase [Agaricicola taiwanensis]
MTVTREKHDRMANVIRALAMDAVEAANSGHPGLPMGTADVATVLFTRFLKFDPTDPTWPNRDRFVLSAGHGSMLIYSVLHLLGSDDLTIDELKRFRQLNSKTPGHPENFMTPGVETTTGPLGQGLGNAVGMALAERILADRFPGIIDHHTYVLASDGDLMEGISQEAIGIAGHLKLNKLIVLWDDNGISIDGPLSLSDSVDQIMRFQSAGWNALRVDGHDPEAIAAAIEEAKRSDKPTMIACKTVIGFGSPAKAGKSAAHGSPLGAAEIAATRQALGWEFEPFDIPSDVRDAWRIAGLQSKKARTAWDERFAALDAETRAEFNRRFARELPARFTENMVKLKEKVGADAKPVATRKSGETVLETVAELLPEIVSGSADLTGSNNTRTKTMKPITSDDFSGNFVHWGIREHAMAAAMNGMALHGGILPVSGTFLVFSDYCRPSIRLAALMGLRVVHVMTHDSIGVGEDGPTHQPVEHLAALRAIPNVLVFRPADTVETAECWDVAARQSRPSVFALTRQNLPLVRTEGEERNLSARGAYELRSADGEARVSLFASGSEVELALEAQKELERRGIPTRVVSVPCMDLFFEQSAEYRAEVIGRAQIKIGVEAAIRMGWDSIIGHDGDFVGMTGFGASGPYKEVYELFGITNSAIVTKAMARLGGNA